METEIILKAKELRRRLHEIPELSMREYNTKKLLMEFLKKNTSLEIVECGKWFYLVWNGAKKGGKENAIAFRADFDAVKGGDGRPGHYCGHDGHAASLAGFAMLISRMKPQRDVYLIFQPGEETGEGALLSAGLLKEKNISEIYGMHNIPGYPEGTIILRKGTFACASAGMEIAFKGSPSHAAYPEAGNNPADAIASMIGYRKEVLSMPHRGMILATAVGIELGGNAYGVSPGSGTVRFTLRAERGDEFEIIKKKFLEKAAGLAKEYALEYTVKLVEEFPATENHDDETEKIERAAKRCGYLYEYPDEAFRWSEDFGCYLKAARGAFFGIGAGKNCPQLHTGSYEFPDGIIETGIGIFAALLDE